MSRLNSIAPGDSDVHTAWITQVSPETKAVWQKDFLAPLVPGKSPEPLGGDFYLVLFNAPVSSGELLSTVFPRWICPLQHQWPVNPRSEKFVERAALGLQQKLGLQWTELQVFATSSELKRTAVGLKGRLLQLQSTSSKSDKFENTNRSQANNKQLIVLLHKKGICAGMSAGAISLGSALAGGLGFLAPQDRTIGPESETDTQRKLLASPRTADQQPAQMTNALSTPQLQEARKENKSPSRAGGKIREILLLLRELNITHNDYPNWLELGAAPGGMTRELIQWGAHVTAVDLAEMDQKIQKDPRVILWKKHANEIDSAHHFNAILCDMNGPSQLSALIVSKLIETLSRGSLIVHTLKAAQLESIKSSIATVSALFEQKGAKILAVRHLFHNRNEVTVVAVKQ